MLRQLISVIAFLIFTAGVLLRFAQATPYYCGTLSATFADSALCASACSPNICQDITPQTGTGVCDSSLYRGFVYHATSMKTYALSVNQNTWDGFANLAMPKTAEINNVIKTVLSYYQTSAWLGAYDKNQSTNYNVIDPTRFIWRDGSSITYSNWLSGQPDNNVAPGDIGVVPILGESWVAMQPDGTWVDWGGMRLSAEIINQGVLL